MVGGNITLRGFVSCQSASLNLGLRNFFFFLVRLDTKYWEMLQNVPNKISFNWKN